MPGSPPLYNLRWRLKNPKQVMLNSARHRAVKQRVPFSLEACDFDIPNCCPVLGIPLERSPTQGGRNASPSLDRRKPELGYIAGNVQVISLLANRIKSNATADQVAMVAAWMRAQDAA